MSGFWRRFLAALTHSGPGYDTTPPRLPAPRGGDAPAELPRRFQLLRHRDVSGISGTGVVALGVCWPDGTASVRWLGDRPSIVFWDRGGMADAEHVHGHGGATEVVWLDPAEEQPS
ncbi:hypothetical protein [Streptomyces violascens]|uniref:Uncharacterized protein n=1 Tax=Streptomyces violascens TaxID=67381 RepID=A0ABQ3QX94_9ACTN|nr:hypothetical protein [Streptomyces violascens]GGU13049.1 hypothetical protein GCM10010289_38350 [Streptomyces violascens]GHI41885.1 hypothetical protein Sviol_62930 [Streptomyces violascens]